MITNHKPKRNTKQKKLILCCLSGGHKCTVDGHHHSPSEPFLLMTAEEIEYKLQNDGHKVGTATVYRALKELCEAGLVRKYIQNEGSAKYRFLGEEREKGVQLLCKDCGCIIDTGDEELSHAINKISSKYGFDVDMTSAVLYGECRECSHNQEVKNNE